MVKKDLPWLALVAFMLTWAISSLWWPFGHDQGIFAWVGDVILNGGTPYRDAWEVKGPAPHYVYALAQFLFGRTMWGIRLLDLCFLALGLAALWRIAGKLSNNTAARLAVALFTLWYAGGGYWMTAQPDGWAAMLLAVAVACLINKGEIIGLKSAAIAGTMIGLCCLVKPIYAGFLLLVVISPLSGSLFAPKIGLPQPLSPTDKKSSRLRFVWPVLVGIAFCGLVIAFTLAWFAYQGALADLLQIQFVFNGSVHRLAHAYGFLDHALLVLGFMQQGWVAITLLPAALGIAVLWSQQRPAAAVIITWTVLALLCVLVQEKYYPYHWLLFYGPLALAAGVGLAHLKGGWIQKNVVSASYQWFATATIALVLILALITPTQSILRWALRVNGYASWDTYYEGFGTYGWGDFSFKADQKVAQYLAARTTAQDPVLVWGFEVLVNYLSGRPSPTRFGYNYPLSRGRENVVEQAYRAEFMQALQANPPLYILILDQDVNNLMPKTSRQFLNDFPEFKSYLNNHYYLETTIEHFTLWRRQPTFVEMAGR
ncbi:MAG: glycosyltransferase family 39 protein [Anaerolineae bacterium]|nr:glycosyltransferase family 39 protein [Anaerolineae bacterium]